MLTPAQLNEISFERHDGDTYSAAEVDSALKRIADDYSSMFAENAVMVKKLGILAAKIEEYRKDENVLRDVLYNAQRSADLIISAANDQADSIVDDAVAKAEKVNEAAEAEYASIISSAKVLSDGYITAAQETADNLTAEAEKTVSELISDCDRKAAAIIESAQAKADAMLDDAKVASEAMRLSAENEVQKRCEDTVNDAKEKAVALLTSKSEQFESVFGEAEDIKAEAKEQANAIIEAAKAKAAEIIKAAESDAESLRKQNEEIANNVLSQVDDTVEKKLIETKLKCDSMLKLARTEAESRIDKAEAAANEYFRQSRSSAAALMVAVNTECEKKLALVKKEASANSDMFLSIKMPDDIPPLDDGLDPDAVLKENGFKHGLDVEKPKFDSNLNDIADVTIEKTEKVYIDPVAEGFSETKKMISETSADSIAEELGVNEGAGAPTGFTVEETEAQFDAVLADLQLGNANSSDEDTVNEEKIESENTDIPEADSSVQIPDIPDIVLDDLDSFEDFENIDDTSLDLNFNFSLDFDEAPEERSSVTEEASSLEKGFEIDFSVFEEANESPEELKKNGRWGKNKKKK